MDKTKAGPDQQNHPTLYPWTTPNSRKRVANPFAPANCQALASSLKACTACYKLGATPIKHTSISMLPNNPCPKDAEGVKAFPKMFL